ncbi:MAG: SRPBCC family protein [Candidatus Acidiferrales bacterium]
MKWVVRVGIVVIGIPSLAIGLLMLGRFRPNRGHIVAEIEIDRPTAQVFPWISQKDLILKWFGGLSEMAEISPGTNGGKIGERFHLTEFDREEDVKLEMEMTVTDFVPNERLGMEIESVGDPDNGFVETAEYSLKSDDGHTQLTCEIHTKYHGRLPEVLEPFITAAARKKVERDLARLKSLAEAQ